MADSMQKLKKEILRLKDLLYHDELTGLLNRRGFTSETQKFLKSLEGQYRFKERKSFLLKNFALIYFDIDNFKKINDRHGHHVGDEALKLFSSIVRERVRDIDLSARWGGEEIVVGLVGASIKDAFRVAENIRTNLLQKHILYHKTKIKFTVSAGVSDMIHAHNFNSLLDLADKALYKAKRLGKNQVQK